MDETDKKILNLLKENARAPYSEIAQQVALSSPAVKARITKIIVRRNPRAHKKKKSLSS